MDCGCLLFLTVLSNVRSTVTMHVLVRLSNCSAPVGSQTCCLIYDAYGASTVETRKVFTIVIPYTCYYVYACMFRSDITVFVDWA